MQYKLLKINFKMNYYMNSYPISICHGFHDSGVLCLASIYLYLRWYLADIITKYQVPCESVYLLMTCSRVYTVDIVKKC